MDGQQPQGQTGESPQTSEQKPAEMKGRVISERVVSEKVLGSSSGMARFGRKVKGQIAGRLGGIGIGLLLILISFFVVWYSVKFDKSAALVASLPLLSVEQAADSTGLIKVSGQITSAPIKTPKEDKEAIYYHFTREELEMVTRTETEKQVITRDGQDIEQTIEREVEKPEWVSKIDEERWAEIVLGEKITVSPEKAKKMLDLRNVYSLQEETVREKIEALLPTEQLLVVGDIANGRINGGDPFIITNKSNQDLISFLESSEKSTWWILKLATLLLFGFGLYLLLGPFLLVLDAIPVLGKIGKGGLLIVCLIIGLIFTVLSSLIIAFWYIILIILIALVGYFVYLRKKQPVKQG